MKRRILMIMAAPVLHAAAAYADETEAAYVSGGFDPNWILIAVGVGILIALLVTGVWKAQLKSVHAKWEAGNYVRRDSLDLRSRNERYLYKNVQMVPIPKQQNQGGHGGAGGTGLHGGGTGSGTMFSSSVHGNATHSSITHSGFSGGTGGLFGGTGGSGGSGHGGGLNYGGHIEPGARPGSQGTAGRPGAAGRPGTAGRPGAPAGRTNNTVHRGPQRPQ